MLKITVDLKNLSFHVNFVTFTPRVQLDICYSCHGGYAYKISWTLVDPFACYFKSKTNRI